MKKTTIDATILAGGIGSRLEPVTGNAYPKALVPVGTDNKPVMSLTLSNLKSLGINQPIIVVHHQKKKVIEAFPELNNFIDQGNTWGTGEALQKALTQVKQDTDHLLMLYADHSYGFSPTILKNLYQHHLSERNAITVVGFVMDEPGSLGRLFVDQAGQLEKIKEAKHLTPKEAQIKLVNSGTMMFDMRYARELVAAIQPTETKPGKTERYATDAIEIAKSQGLKVGVFVPENFDPFPGINTPEDLEAANLWLQSQSRD